MAKASPQALLIRPEAYHAMVSHCVKGSLLASCGILAGVPPTAVAAYPLRNAAESPTRYESDPRDLVKTQVDLRKRGLEVVAIYHCRPKTAAMPSPGDLRENAYPSLPRVIVALGDAPSIRVWSLSKRYCEELSWRLEPGDEGPAPDGAGGDELRPDGAGESSDRDSPSRPGSVLSWLFGRRPTSGRIPIGRLRDLPPLKPEPMWDPVLDHPGEPEIPSE